MFAGFAAKKTVSYIRIIVILEIGRIPVLVKCHNQMWKSIVDSSYEKYDLDLR